MHKYTHAPTGIYMNTHIHTPSYLRNHPKSIPFLVSLKHTMLLNTCYGFVRAMDWREKLILTGMSLHCNVYFMKSEKNGDY